MSKKFSVGSLSEKLGFIRRQIKALYETLSIPKENQRVKGRKGSLIELTRELDRLRKKESRALKAKKIKSKVARRIRTPLPGSRQLDDRLELFKEASRLAKARGVRIKKLADKGSSAEFFRRQIRELKKREKKYNVHIVAKYNFGTRARPLLSDVDIQFSTSAFSKREIREKIDSLRESWQVDQQNIIDGKTNWIFDSYVSIDIVRVRESQLVVQPMLGTKWNYQLLGDIDKININAGKCVPDYLLYEFSRSKGNFKHMTRENIIALLGGDKNGYTTEDIIILAKQSNYISVHALSPMLEVFEHYRAKEHTRINLCFIVNNSHCYPIIDKTFKDQIIYKNKLDLGKFKFDVSYDNHKYYESETSFLDAEKEENKVCLVESNNLSKLAKKVMDKTKSIIQGMKFYYHTLTSFEHPDGYIVESAKDYFLRKEVCLFLRKQYKTDEFIFRNQTWTTISYNLFQYGFDDLQKSRLSDELEDIYEKYPVGPYMKKISNTKFDRKTCFGFDICKSYTSVLLNNTDDFPIFTPLDEVKPISQLIDWIEDDRFIDWVAGEYYIKRTIKMARNTIVLNKGFYPLNLTRYALDNGYIKFDDITHFIKASTSLKANHFNKFVEYCFHMDIFSDSIQFQKGKRENMKTVNEYISKSLVNYMTGYLNKKYSISEKGCITDSYKMACGTFMEENKKGNDCFINKIKDLYIIRSTTKRKILETSSPIWRHIICGGIMNLDKMHSKLTDENSIVISYKVDAIMIKNPKADYKQEIVKKKDKKIGDIVRESWSVSGKLIDIDSRPTYIHKEKIWIEKSYNHSEEAFNELKEGSYIIYGISGSGKSTILSKLIQSQPERKAKVLCFTNKAVTVLKKKGIKDVSTFDSIFYNKDTKKRDYLLGCRFLSKYDDIYGDEYGMNSWRYMDFLYMLKKAGKNIRLFGDENQCSPIEEYSPPRTKTNTSKLYDYKNSLFVKNLCDCRCYCVDYLPQYGRYDDKLHKVVKYLLKHEKLHKSCKDKTIKVNLAKNIAYTNKKCDEINNKCIEQFKSSNNRNFTTCKNKYWQEGMPIISNINSKINKINRSEMYTIETINTHKKIIKLKNNNAEFDFNYITDNFSHGFCVTVHRMQGDEIADEYNIYQIWMMSKELLYTAIGRGTKFDNVHFEYNSKIFCKERVYDKSVIIPPSKKKIIKKIIEKNKKTKIQVIQDVHVNKFRFAEFNIKEYEDSYSISYRKEGKRKFKRVRFGKKITKEQAFEKITKIRDKLRKANKL